MRALHIPTAGATRIGDVPIPVVTEGTVLIRVKAAALNPIDNGIAGGFLAGTIPRRIPGRLGPRRCRRGGGRRSGR